METEKVEGKSHKYDLDDEQSGDTAKVRRDQNTAMSTEFNMALNGLVQV